MLPTCDFGNVAHSLDDVPFACNNKLIGARQMLATYRFFAGAAPDEFDSARDDDGHGTHTASTAAGNADVAAEIYGNPVGTISGVAPRAHVIAYKVFGNLGGFDSDVAAGVDQAVADGVDVINFSGGSPFPSLTTATDIAYLFAADAGVFVASSAGNTGPGAATIGGGPTSVPWVTTVGASTQKRFFQGEARRDGADNLARGTSLTPGTGAMLPLVDAEFAGGDLCIPGTLDSGTVLGRIVLCRRGVVGRTEKSLAVLEAGGAGMILYNNSDDDSLVPDRHWVPSLHVALTPGLEIKAYIASSPAPQTEIKTGKTSNSVNAPTMAGFSSRGPDLAAEDLIKPDITAPGVQILAGASPFPDPFSVPPGELFGALQGTSMSSPHVAGVFALLKQVHPDWTPAMAKSAIMTTADPRVRDHDGVSEADPFAMGAGHLDPGKVKKKGSAFEPGLVYDAGFVDYLGFLCDEAPEIFVNPVETCADLAAFGVPTDATNLNLPSIGIAELRVTQTVTRTVKSVADKTVKWQAKADPPPGYTVTVDPSEITLAPGAVASYQVTITDDGSAPVGEWRFGSLEWKGLGTRYEARSPIAVRSTLMRLEAPDRVFGSGSDGSGSFDVTFGYTGAYTAAPHGLVADAPTSDTIDQDPDGTYPSGDDAAGGIDKIPFVVSGPAFVRWRLRISGFDDLDLSLEDAAGNIIAASTGAFGDELIEGVAPPGTYTAVVHGIDVGIAPSPYTLSFWEVPLAPGGGSLSIDGAPAAAVRGATGTVDYSWAGLAGGVDYLGAVLHSDAGGIFGLTLVDVTN